METGTIELITSLIGTMGFPIVCCIFMWKYINGVLKDFTAMMQRNNTLLEKLCDRLDREDRDK